MSYQPDINEFDNGQETYDIIKKSDFLQLPSGENWASKKLSQNQGISCQQDVIWHTTTKLYLTRT